MRRSYGDKQKTDRSARFLITNLVNVVMRGQYAFAKHSEIEVYKLTRSLKKCTPRSNLAARFLRLATFFRICCLRAEARRAPIRAA